MFTVKAIVDGESPDGALTAIHQAALVTVRRSKVDGCNAPGQRPYVAPQFEVELEGGPSGRFFITVGSDPFDHHQTVYIMNDRGATVETVRASIPPKVAAA